MDFDTVNSLKAKGNKAFVDGKYDIAIGYYKEALNSVGPADSEDLKVSAILHSNISQVYLKKKKYPLAVESATESLKLDPSFKKSNLRRAAANIELDNLADAMKDLRLIFSYEPKNKAAGDLMKRCSNNPKINQGLHMVYVKHYLRQLLKKLGAQIVNRLSGLPFHWLRNALLRQSFLSTKSSDIANNFFYENFVGFQFDQNAFISFFGWLPCQLMWLKYSYTPVDIAMSAKLFKVLYHLFRPKTFSLTIPFPFSLNDETLLANKYFDVFLTKEGMLGATSVDENDLNMMNRYSNDMTRLLYTPGLADLKKAQFPKANVLTFDGKHLITSDFLKLWKKNEWPIKLLSFIYGFPDLRVLKQFDGVISNQVNEVFIRFAEVNHAFNKITYDELCSNLEALKNIFPGITDVTITHRYGLKASTFPQFVQNMALVREAYETISTKPDWCSKLRVMVFIDFMAKSHAEFKMFDVKLLEQSVVSLRQKHTDMKIRFCGPRFYGPHCISPCLHAVIEFENEVASFEMAFVASFN